jgi:hypothetical protein
MMQAIELETDILPKGNIHLPEAYRTWYGEHAKIIVLLTDTVKKIPKPVAPIKLRGGKLKSEEIVNIIRQSRDAVNI